jgi:hypothetical protein
MRSERSEARPDTRAGHYERKLQAKAGEVKLWIPKLRQQTFETAIIERYRRRESSAEEALIEMYLAGVSVRREEDITEALWGTPVSLSTVSDPNKKIYGTIEAWRNRLIDREHPYVYFDGIVLKRSWAGEVRNVSLLAAYVIMRSLGWIIDGFVGASSLIARRGYWDCVAASAEEYVVMHYRWGLIVAFRIARGLFGLWLVGPVVWICAVGTNMAVATTTVTSTFTASNGVIPPATYYISTTGNDANPGTLALPWATPNHPVKCEDTINLQPGVYNGANFTTGKWGVVYSCPSANGVYMAKLICNSPNVQDCAWTTTSGILNVYVDKSNWAIIGGIATNNFTYGACFTVGAGALYVAFVNVYAKSCGAGVGGGEYTAYVGDLLYGGGGGGGQCFSNLSIFEPTPANPSDTGTHIFVYSNFIINAKNPTNCTDGEGVILDTWWKHNYNQKSVIKNNLFSGNSSACFESFGTAPGGSTPIAFFKNNTCYGDAVQTRGSNGPSSIQIVFFSGVLNQCCISIDNNISVSTHNLSPNNGNHTPPLNLHAYALEMDFTGGGQTATNNYLWNTVASWYFLINNPYTSNPAVRSTGNVYADPVLTAPTLLTAAPDCSASATIYACMNSYITALTPTAAGAIGKGYQRPGPCTPDPDWPVWLKGIVPDGIVTKPCGM